MGEKKLIYYIFILIVAVVGLISYFISYPQFQKIEARKKEAKSKQAELKNLQKKEIELKELDLTYNAYQDQIDMITALFPKVKNFSDYLTQIETSANRTGMKFKSIKIAGQQSKDNKEPVPELTQMAKNGDFYELPIDITVTPNNYQGFVNFVATLEKLSRFTTVKRCSMKIVESESGPEREGTVNLIIYVLP